MNGITLFNALANMDDNIIQKYSTVNEREEKDVKSKKKRRLVVMLASAAAVLTLAFGVIFGAFIKGRNGILPGSSAGPSGDWPYYKNAYEIINASSNIYSGVVTDISFTVLDNEGNEATEPASNNPSRMFYTVYTVEIENGYKGKSEKTAKIVINGGLSGYKEAEQKE